MADIAQNNPVFAWLRRFFGLLRGTDVEGTITEIRQGVRLRGSNIWMLICSAILASIGLDVNSTAVIIGAMLISPLMSPILGVGLATAIFDRGMLRSSLKNLAIAAFLGLLTSVIYFWISPLSQMTTELSARTTPTLLDVGVAFFGGVAGIVAGSRRNKTNAIPGVAIATALMPPLCTAGFGLANYNTPVFLGAFYLFFLNAVFIALATYLVAVMLRFPRKELPDGETDIQVKRVIIGFVVITILPSAVIFWRVVDDVREKGSVESFVEIECRRDNRQPLKWEISESEGQKVLKVYIVGDEITNEERQRLQTSLNSYGLGDLRLQTVQLNVSIDEFRRLNTDVVTNLSESVRVLQVQTDERAGRIQDLESQLKQLQERSDPKVRFLYETKDLIPQILEINWAEQIPGEDNAKQPSEKLEIVFVDNVDERERARVVRRVQARARMLLADDLIEVAERKQPMTDSGQ
ncbi:MAG: DUF389 domain-containing protein [Acidobacteria bacterium]|nr:DUF389 domain-containing protein [Acidobacteriota bacterium]